jgi:cell division protein FtsZ
MAVSSPLLEASIEGAHGVLLSIAGGSDLGLFEINEAAALVSQSAHAESNIIFGAVIDDALGDEVRVTVIAAGFDGGMPKRREAAHLARREPVASQADVRAAASTFRREPERVTVPAERPQYGANSMTSRQEERRVGGQSAPSSMPSTGAPAGQPSTPARPARPLGQDDDLDVPDFLK